MTIQELWEACNVTDPLNGYRVQHIYLTLPRKTLPKGDDVLLSGRSGPKGRICNVKQSLNPLFKYDVAANFKTGEILKWINSHDSE